MTPGLHYTFTRHRNGAAAAFMPDGRGSVRLTLRSLADDALELGSLPAGVLAPGDAVSVSRGGVTVFRGLVSVRSWHGWRGSSAEEGFTVHGPWRRLSRIPFTQQWMMMVTDDSEPPVSTPRYVPSSRTVLNQDDAGLPVTVRAQVLEIIAAAAALGIVAAPDTADVAAVPAGLTLPFDEGRDMTLAQALARELRYTPRLAARFDYAEDPPRLRVVAPGAADAPWLAGALAANALLDARESQDGLPPLGCLLEIQEAGNVNGGAYAVSSAQTAGDVSDPERTLRAVLPVAGVDTSRDVRTLELETAAIPADLNDPAFWIRWHKDLRGMDEADIVISAGARTGAGDNPGGYPRFVTTAGVGLAELQEAGFAGFRIEFLTCTAKIQTYVHVPDPLNPGLTMGAHSVESAELSLEVIATSATTRRYSWTDAFDHTGAEPAPPGLAAALLAAHQADGLSAEVTIALNPGTAIPSVGDTRAGLAAQSVSADLKGLTATVAFGPPAPLGAADLAGFLTAFRNLRRSEAHYRRATGDLAQDARDATLTHLPSTSSGFMRSVEHISIAAPVDGSSAAIIDPSVMPPGNSTAALREIEFMTEDSEGKPLKLKAWFLANKPVDEDGNPVDPGPEPCDPCSDHPGGNGWVDGTGGGGWTDGGSTGGDGWQEESSGGDGGWLDIKECP